MNHLNERDSLKTNKINFEDSDGKTVARVFAEYDNMWLIVFTDGTFSVVQAYEDDREPYLENGGFFLGSWGENADELLSLGAISQDEHDRFMEGQKNNEAAERQRRFDEYMKLKREFEGNQE